MLKLENISCFYGKVQALKSVSIEVPEGAIVSLLGANGAGKSTTLKVISRLVNPASGTFQMNGESMLKETPSKMVQRGAVHCPENRRVFPRLTVEENLMIGAYTNISKTK